jgi:acetyltransferase
MNNTLQLDKEKPPAKGIRRDQPLDAFFSPKSVAVVGATETEGSVGRTIFRNLLSSQFGGTVFPVNPKRSSVMGVKAYPTLSAITEPIDQVVVITPAEAVPRVIHEAVDLGVNAATVISAGFKETGARGAELEAQIMAEARRGKIRIIGPNCLGVMSPWNGFNATFATAIARPGHVGFISQSGALCTAILDWSFRELVGFSAFLSIGSMLDVGWGDLIYYLGDDPRTRSIVIYMETIGNARSFLSAAREVALTKPIIVIKAGRTEAAAKAAASHTGSMAGSDGVLDAAFRRCGVLRVDRISDLFYMAEVLDKQPRPQGPRLTILTNAGGPGVLATDALIEEGGALAQIEPETITALNQVLPAHWSHQNPIDLIGDAGPDRYAKAVEIVAKDKNSDGLLVVLTPQGMTGPAEIAEKLRPYAKLNGKPILASWMGGTEVAAGESILNRAGIPTFLFPDTAARAFQYMWRYAYNLRGLYETPSYAADRSQMKTEEATQILDAARNEGRTLLTELESKRILAAYGIPITPTLHAADEDAAVEMAKQTGFPVVLKLHSTTITHKTDVGGVRLNLPDESAVRDAFRTMETTVHEKAGEGHFQGVTVQPMIKTEGYELILGSSVDPQFGPVLLFGCGGQLVEVFRDRALALPPLNTTLARRMMEQTKIFKALEGVRGRKPVDIVRLEELIVRFSQLVVEQPSIKEIDINPLLASSHTLMALDGRVVLHSREVKPENLPRTAIRPYPDQYSEQWKLRDGTPVTIRPIRPEDEPMMVGFHESLSDRSVHFRYFHLIHLTQRVAHDRLARHCFIDYDREMVLIAERRDAKGGPEIIAVARLTKQHKHGEAEFAMILSDAFQGFGLGTELLRRLLVIARDEKIGRVTGSILPENQAMQRLCRKLGFEVAYDIEEGVVRAEIEPRQS